MNVRGVAVLAFVDEVDDGHPLGVFLFYRYVDLFFDFPNKTLNVRFTPISFSAGSVSFVPAYFFGFDAEEDFSMTSSSFNEISDRRGYHT